MDVRLCMTEGDLRDYVAELDEAEPGARHGGRLPGPRTHLPAVVATAWQGGQWEHDFLALSQVKDYFKSLLQPPKPGPKLRTYQRKMKAKYGKADLEVGPDPDGPKWPEPETHGFKINLETNE